MQRTTTMVAIVSVCGGALATVGCNQELKAKEAHIALIEDTNQQLTQKLAAAQQESDRLTQERDQCRGQLKTDEQTIDDLRAQLAKVPETTTAQGWQTVPGGAMIAIPGNVLFASGKANLRDAGRATLDEISSTLRSEYTTKDIFVFGHTDDTPIKKSGWKDNYELSAQRALTVVRYLASHGIETKRLIACGAGQYRPRVPNSDAANRSQNRRVEIFAVNPTK